eukprot:951661-Ditylum_brightwellii.AAC.1
MERERDCLRGELDEINAVQTRSCDAIEKEYGAKISRLWQEVECISIDADCCVHTVKWSNIESKEKLAKSVKKEAERLLE